jgi:choline dehydrogenase-like flavoprotein
MGTDPKTSVVDVDCRVHGVANLYIASAAVFPTSSQANPTLTIVALALRLVEHLASECGRGDAKAQEILPTPGVSWPIGVALS